MKTSRRGVLVHASSSQGHISEPEKKSASAPRPGWAEMNARVREALTALARLLGRLSAKESAQKPKNESY